MVNSDKMMIKQVIKIREMLNLNKIITNFKVYIDRIENHFFFLFK